MSNLNYNQTLQFNNVDLQEVLQILQTKAGGTQATPVISVNATNGLITATAGTKSSTHQLAFQPAKTITPSTASQIAVSSGYYTGGNITVAAVPTQSKSVTPKATNQNVTPDSGKFLSKVTVAGDSNLVAGNIKKGISIFGVSGTLEEGDGMSSGEQVEWSANEDAIISRSISSYFNDRVTTIGSYAFYFCDLTTVSFPVCKSINGNAFYNCTNLTTVSFPACTNIANNAFNGCTNLTTVSFPACTNIASSAFYNCIDLTTVSFPVCTTIGSYAFYRCINLTTVSFPACTSINAWAFNDCTNLTTVSFPACTNIASSAFYNCTNLTTVSFPACTNIGNNAFYRCINLTTVSFPACTSINAWAFSGCTNLTTVSFPVCTNISMYAFSGCTNLTTVSFPVCTNISHSAFYNCYNLKSLYLTNSSLCELSNSNAFTSTPIGGYSTSAGTYGSIYVPASLLTSYQTATNWTYFSSRFVGI